MNNKNNFKPTYLYIKTHNKTKLKYFGKTTSQNPYKYPGSGLYWTRHLEKYGDDVTTEIIGYYKDLDSLINDAVKFSFENNIVESKEWANIRIETGLTGGDTSDCFTLASRQKISNAVSGVNNPNAKLTHDQVIEIYHSRESPETLSKKFNIGTGQIFGIKRKIYYKEITKSIIEMPGVFLGKKKVRYILPTEAIIDIFLKEETYLYFKEKYNASRQVVKNIKSRKSYKDITKHLENPGFVKKYNLSNKDTVDIFYSKESVKILSKKYNVTGSTIRNIKNGASRKYFLDDF